jgi:Rv2525c-like, glycoside hydrolase-like domain
MGVRLPPRAPSIFKLLSMNCSQRIAKLPTPKFDSALLFLLVGVSACALCLSFPAKILGRQPTAPSQSYLGFDLNTYPGDAALPVLRETFSFGGYWLSAPPEAKQNTWVGKRRVMLSQKFGFLILYNGPLSRELKSSAQSGKKGTSDAANASAAAKKEGFPSHAIIFLDVEEGGRLPANYHTYLRTWVDELARAGYRAGVYCSGIAVNEGNGVTIITAEDIRNNIGKRDLAYFVFNDFCPPAPGCTVRQNPSPPSASGISYAAVWQFAQSPRRKERTAHCAATYNRDGNCYAPGDSAHTWFLDLNSATSPDPSSGRDGAP